MFSGAGILFILMAVGSTMRKFNFDLSINLNHMQIISVIHCIIVFLFFNRLKLKLITKL